MSHSPDDFFPLQIATDPFEVLNGHTDPVLMARFSHDGQFLVSTDGRSVCIWKWNEERLYVLKHTLEIDTAMVAISHDGRFIAAVEESRAFLNKLHIWSPEGELLASLSHRGEERTLIFSPEEPLLVVADDSGRLQLWDMMTFALLCESEVPPESAQISLNNAVRCLAFAPDGRRLAVQWYTNHGGVQIAEIEKAEGTITFDDYSEVAITGGTSTITNYFSVAGQRVAMRKGAILSYLLPDFLGSDNIALNYDGSIQSVQLFAPYGSVRYSDQIMPTDYSFTGQRLDSQTGLLYDNARYYDPVGGRFTSADIVQNNATGLDPYAYVGDSPETWTDPTGHAGGPGVDDPTGLGQLFGDIQTYLNSQNPYVSGAEVTAAVVTAPIWVPVVLLVVILSIPSDSSQPNQSQNTSVSPTPEATPATNTDGAGARCCNFRRPNDRHFFSKINRNSTPKKKNTVIMPWVDVNADVAAINAGNVTPVKGVYTVNGRNYEVEANGTLVPTTGDGFIQLDRGAYKALGIYKSLGVTEEANEILNKMGIPDDVKEKALSIFEQGNNYINGKGGK